jgi:16S rRNA (adenine1518-N6/adenine1519-N6)-dimethyltransferase
MENLSNIGVIRDVMQRHGFTFSKALGQNFLINPTVCPRMAELGGAQPGVGVIEIGAGVGVLTMELSKRADKVVCIEIDGRLLPVLDETLSGCANVEIVNADVMKVDLRSLIEEKFRAWKSLCAPTFLIILHPRF